MISAETDVETERLEITDRIVRTVVTRSFEHAERCGIDPNDDESALLMGDFQ